LQELIERADARIAEYLKQLDEADGTEAASPTPTQAALAAKIAALREKKEWHEELRAQLDEANKQISVTDADARKMRTGNGFVVGYNAQAAVDAKNKLIAAADVTNEETDVQQLGSVAARPRKTWAWRSWKWWLTKATTATPKSANAWSGASRPTCRRPTPAPIPNRDYSARASSATTRRKTFMFARQARS